MVLIGEGGQLDGKYEILKRLGSGGMGEVYLVRHNHLHQLRVVKVLRADLASDEAAGQRFHQEARTAIRIKHPNVATLYDYAQLGDGRYYMVWEYIEGEDVGAALKRQGPMAPALAIELAIQALRGLDAIHSAGVIHRDISPDNLMVTRDNRDRYLVKIIDLGLAKSLGNTTELTQAGTFLGKLQYCSPEQAGYRREEALDHRSDLYSLSLVLYEMICGLPPFESESQHGYVLKRLSEEPVPLLGRNPQVTIPPELATVVMRGLERDRERRFSDATAFIQALAGVGERLGRADQREGASVPAGDDPPASAAEPPRRKPAELTREERIDLLAQIEHAADRVRATSQHMGEAEAALREGRFEEARTLIQRLEEANPRLRGLAELKARLADAEQIARRRQQVMQAEQMLEKYLLEKQQTLASLALEALLGLYPNHPRRSDYEAWVKRLGEEAEEQKTAERAFAAGREAISRGDVEAARGQLSQLERHELSGKLAGTLLADINEAEKRRAAVQQTEAHREAFEQQLAAGDCAAAEVELEALAGLDLPRVTLDFYRTRLSEASAGKARDVAAEGFEVRYREVVAVQDWSAARDIAVEMQAALPDSPGPPAMFAEIGRLQEAAQREQAVREGLSRFDGFLEEGRLAEAALALRILKQIAADRPEVEEAERRLAATR